MPSSRLSMQVLSRSLSVYKQRASKWRHSGISNDRHTPCSPDGASPSLVGSSSAQSRNTLSRSCREAAPLACPGPSATAPFPEASA